MCALWTEYTDRHPQHLLTTAEGGLVDILSFGLLGPSTPGSDPTRELRLAIKKHCEELLPEAIGLSDGFGFTDWELDRSVCSHTYSTNYIECGAT